MDYVQRAIDHARRPSPQREKRHVVPREKNPLVALHRGDLARFNSRRDLSVGAARQAAGISKPVLRDTRDEQLTDKRSISDATYRCLSWADDVLA